MSFMLVHVNHKSIHGIHLATDISSLGNRVLWFILNWKEMGLSVSSKAYVLCTLTIFELFLETCLVGKTVVFSHRSNCPCDLSHNAGKRNPLQVEADMLHIAISSCNLRECHNITTIVTKSRLCWIVASPKSCETRCWEGCYTLYPL